MEQLRTSCFLFAFIMVLSSCGNSKNEKPNLIKENTKSDTINQNVRPFLATLEEGEIHITDSLFGKTINLTGIPLNLKGEIHPTQMIVKDNYLIIVNMSKDSIFKIFELPDLKCISSFGVKYIGQEFFEYPKAVETEEDSILFYIYERLDDKIYKVTRDHLYPEYYLTLPKQKHDIGDKQITFIDSKSAYYSATSGDTKIIYYFHKDSLPQERIVKDLEIRGNKGSWATVIGDFGINKFYGRIVYAYKYFKRLKIIDEQTLKERNIIFESIEMKKGLNNVETLEPTNITHFCGLSPKDDYFWMLYSGRNPIDVQAEIMNNKKYIFVEKYDWNGNPLKRYKLDNWGYFCVDEEENTIYLASTADKNTLLMYSLNDSINN